MVPHLGVERSGVGVEEVDPRTFRPAQIELRIWSVSPEADATVPVPSMRSPTGQPITTLL